METKKLWTCPTCGRQFERRGQTHSCRSFPLKQHFEGKPEGLVLYEKLKREVKEQIGFFKIESLECCIHFVSTSTFLAVKIFKNKIQIDFTLSRKTKDRRITQYVQMSAHRYLYCVDIQKEEEINEELMGWIQEAYDSKKERKRAQFES
jgi:Domain of unknown function (DUF5655)